MTAVQSGNRSIKCILFFKNAVCLIQYTLYYDRNWHGVVDKPLARGLSLAHPVCWMRL